MRIAFIAPSPASAIVPAADVKPRYASGEHPTSWVHALARSLASLPDVVLRVFVHSRAVRRPCEGAKDGVAYRFIPKREPIRTDPFHGFLPGRRAMKSALADFNPDVAVGFGIENGSGFVAAALPWPSVFFIQGIMEKLNPFQDLARPRKALFERLERRTLRLASGVVAETDFARSWALSRGARGEVAVIPHAVNPDFLAVHPDRWSPRLLCVGTLHAIKGTDTVIRAFARTTHPLARLILVGSGPLQADYGYLASELGVANRVEFAGHLGVKDLLFEMSRARLLVLGSRMDTSPNVVTEAHAAGLPVVATRAGGIPDMVETGQDGLLVDVEDDRAMGKCLDDLLRDPARCEAMGRAGRERARLQNDPLAVARRHLEFYRAVCTRNPKTGGMDSAKGAGSCAA
jgi:glycosyltransferase involved in cell wall biosynthesis